MLLRLALVLCLYAAPAWAREYGVRLTQEDCADASRWELWGSRNGDASVPVVGFPASAVSCPADEATPIEAVVDTKLRNGTWGFTLRVFEAGGTFSDSEGIFEVFPMPKPKLQRVIRR